MAPSIRAWLVLQFTMTLVLSLATTAAIHTDGSLASSVHNLLARQATSVGVNATLNDPPTGNPIVAWVAFGDSFSAGPGAGAPYANNVGKCFRRVGAYPPQLQQSSLFQRGFSNPNLNFLSCTGDITTQVMDNQIPSISSRLPSIGLVTLSIGGNDIGFAKILTACIFNPLGSCTNAINSARNILYGGTFHNNYIAMINALLNNLNWCPQSGTRTRAYDCYTMVYQTAYPSFFESYTTQCNDAIFLPIIGPKLSQSLRGSLNQLGQELNTMIAYFIANINHEQRTTLERIGDFIVFADQGERYAGHRFCRAGVTEPDRNNPETWFFNLRSNADTATAFGGSNPTGPASAYQAIDPNSCQTTDEIGQQLACAFSQLVNAGILSPDDQLPEYTAPESRTKTFHPTTAGFGAVSAELQQRLNYVNYLRRRVGKCPTLSGLSLRIVGIGDSITAGYGSSDGQGYFTVLDDNLNLLNIAPLCIPNQYSFIGSQMSGRFQNEGYFGQTVSNIQASVTSSGILRQRPNLILITAGTNDIHGGSDPLVTAQTLSLFVDYLFSQCPDATILVQHIPPIGYHDFGALMSTVQQNVIKYNAAISVMVDTRRAQGQHITKMHQVTTTYDHSINDDLHPNDNGYELIGDAWAERITDAAANGWIGNPVLGPSAGPLSNNQPCDKPPNWYPNGQIANGAGLGANRYPDIICFDAPENADKTQCGCGNADGSGINYVQPRTGSSCADMSYHLINAVHFADINGDGLQDYLWVAANGAVTAFINGGPKDPTQTLDLAQVIWYPAGVIATGVGGRRHEIQFADLDGDGRAEYLFVHANGAVEAWVNGGFQWQGPVGGGSASVIWINQSTPIATGIGDPGSWITFADVNGDGRAEYLSVNNIGAVRCYLNGHAIIDDGPNAGHRNWIDQGVIATGVGGIRNNTVFADINGDGRADYLKVTRIGSGAVEWWFNQGGPDINGPDAAKVGWSNRSSITGGDGTSGANVMFADLNGDGRAEYLEVDPNTSAVTAYFSDCPTS